MSDLRTRIAKAVYALIQAPVRPFDEQPDHIKAMWFEEADAVIRELGLQREDGECLYCHAQLPCGRYVAWDKDTDE